MLTGINIEKPNNLNLWEQEIKEYKQDRQSKVTNAWGKLGE